MSRRRTSTPPTVAAAERRSSTHASVSAARAGSQDRTSKKTTARRLDAPRRSRWASRFDTSPTATVPACSSDGDGGRSRRPRLLLVACGPRRHHGLDEGHEPPAEGRRASEVRQLQMAVGVDQPRQQHAGTQVALRPPGCGGVAGRAHPRHAAALHPDPAVANRWPVDRHHPRRPSGSVRSSDHYNVEAAHPVSRPGTGARERNTPLLQPDARVEYCVPATRDGSLYLPGWGTTRR